MDGVQEMVIAGGPDDYLEARHVVLRGTNRDIGRAIGNIARSAFDSQPLGPTNPTRAQESRRYIHEHYPIHEQRILGAAEAYGVAEEDATFVGLPYLMPPLPGCSVAFVPPTRTANGGGLVSRNLDFPLEFGAAPPDADRLAGSEAPKGVKTASRPYLFEVHPDQGYPSLYFSLYDLFACCDGINSEGLVVAMLADDESAAQYPGPPVTKVGVGLHPLQTTRMLLDTCSTVEEAKRQLLMTKTYAFMIPAHFMIADRHGNSFVWEWAFKQHTEHIVEGGGGIQLVTNHLLHEPAPAEVSVEADPGWTRTRLARLTEAVTGLGDGITSGHLRDTHATVRFTTAFAREMTGDPEADTVGRTIWHAVYDIDARTLDVSFYLGDNEDGTDRRSEYQTFQLRV
ncbi:MAG: linear amide C-N hydrolase [bacterium]|nr:linear amide C-N hydrolase [bacterium]